MEIDYKKLWKEICENGSKSRIDSIPMAGISTSILAKLSKDEFIWMESMHRFCRALNIDVEDTCVICNEFLEKDGD